MTKTSIKGNLSHNVRWSVEANENYTEVVATAAELATAEAAAEAAPRATTYQGQASRRFLANWLTCYRLPRFYIK